MANVNLNSGKITGAKKDSLTYYHEVGHLKFEKHCPVGNRVRIIQDMSLRTLIFATALTVVTPFLLLKLILILIILTNAIAEIWEETWCWNYAKKILLGKMKDDERIKEDGARKV